MKKVSVLRACTIFAITMIACGGNAPSAPAIVLDIVFSDEGRIYGADPDSPQSVSDISAALSGLSPLPEGGEDEWASVSRGGAWLLVSTERFGFGGWAGLVIVSGDLSAYEYVRDSGGATINGAGFGVVSEDGSTVIVSASVNHLGHDVSHIVKYVKTGGTWSGPVDITVSAAAEMNCALPSLSFDEASIVFDYGTDPYGQEGTGIAFVGIDGTGFAVIALPEGRTGGTVSDALHHPCFAPDGDIVFEGTWGGGERIWTITPGDDEDAATLITNEFGNDNSPRVMSDGRILSLWLGRPEGSSFHELKLMASDGSSYTMLVVDVDIDDTGYSTSR